MKTVLIGVTSFVVGYVVGSLLTAWRFERDQETMAYEFFDRIVPPSQRFETWLAERAEEATP